MLTGWQVVANNGSFEIVVKNNFLSFVIDETPFTFSEVGHVESSRVFKVSCR